MIKGLAAVRAGKTAEGSAAYLATAWQELSCSSRASCAHDWRQPEVLISALRYLTQALWVIFHATFTLLTAFSFLPWVGCAHHQILVWHLVLHGA